MYYFRYLLFFVMLLPVLVWVAVYRMAKLLCAQSYKLLYYIVPTEDRREVFKNQGPVLFPDD
jgi:hypothetical protein